MYKKINDEKKDWRILNRYELTRHILLYVGRLGKKKEYAAFWLRLFVKFKHHDEKRPEKLALIGRCQFRFLRDEIYCPRIGLTEECRCRAGREKRCAIYFQDGALAYILPSLHEGFWHHSFAGARLRRAGHRFWFAGPARSGWFCGIIFLIRWQEKCGEMMEKIAVDEKLRAELIAKGLQRAKEFSWEKCAQETLQALVAKD